MRKLICLAAAGLLAVLLSGCMGAVPIDQRMLVQAMGIDWEEEQYRVTLQVFSPKGGESEKTKTEVHTSAGQDLSECMRKVQMESGKKLFLGNCRLVILGEPAAAERTVEVVDHLLSNHELRPGTPLYIAQEAAPILNDPETEADQLQSMMRSAEQAGFCPDSTLLTVVRSLESLGSSAAMGRMEQVEGGTIRANGAVLIGSAGMVDFTPEKWRGISWMRGDLERAEYTVNYKGGKLYAQIVPVQTRLTGGTNPGDLEFHLHVECTLQEYFGGALNWDSAEVAAVRAVVEQAVRQEIEQGFLALKTAEADVVCALEVMQKFQPGFCRDRTPEEVFASLSLQPSIQVNITALGAGAHASA